MLKLNLKTAVTCSLLALLASSVSFAEQKNLSMSCKGMVQTAPSKDTKFFNEDEPYISLDSGAVSIGLTDKTDKDATKIEHAGRGEIAFGPRYFMVVTSRFFMNSAQKLEGEVLVSLREKLFNDKSQKHDLIKVIALSYLPLTLQSSGYSSSGTFKASVDLFNPEAYTQILANGEGLTIPQAVLKGAVAEGTVVNANLECSYNMSVGVDTMKSYSANVTFGRTK